jgi:hypothetical protein
MVGYNCFIIFQYHYLNIKILKFYGNFELLKRKWILKFYEILKFFAILENLVLVSSCVISGARNFIH